MEKETSTKLESILGKGKTIPPQRLEEAYAYCDFSVPGICLCREFEPYLLTHLYYVNGNCQLIRELIPLERQILSTNRNVTNDKQYYITYQSSTLKEKKGLKLLNVPKRKVLEVFPPIFSNIFSNGSFVVARNTSRYDQSFLIDRKDNIHLVREKGICQPAYQVDTICLKTPKGIVKIDAIFYQGRLIYVSTNKSSRQLLEAASLEQLEKRLSELEYHDPTFLNQFDDSFMKGLKK